MQKIMVIEDDTAIQEELALLLENEGYTPLVVTNFTDILGQAVLERPDLILLDIGLPRRDGFSLCAALRKAVSAPIIFVTSRDAGVDEVRALSLGGDDYITKPYSVPVLLARIKAVLRRSSGEPEPADTLEAGGLRLSLTKGVVSANGKTAELTRNELQILACLMAHTGQIVSRADLIDALWDNQIYIDDNTLSVNMTRLRGKLTEIGLPDAIKTRNGVSAMTLREFLSDRLGRIALWLVCIALAALFLFAAGTQPGVLALLMLALFLVFVTVQAADFLRQRARLLELEAILEGLDRKYLFAECVPPPKSLYERRLFDLTRRAGRAMAGAVSDAQAQQREYREYVEQWVHEIKAPITAARLICRDLDGETRRKLIAELAQVEAHIERALFYARAENPEQDCLLRQIDLGKVAAQAIENHRSLLIQSGVQVVTEELDCTVYTDEKWAVFILGQLLQNAARYRGTAPVITLSAKPLGKQTQLIVHDNGIGIPAHELPRVFDRGFTGSNGRNRGGSTGMGLYLCKKLAGFLELGLEIASEEGKGTTVTLTFPAKENLTKL